MAIFKFDGFVFDSTRYHLTQRGKRIALRPKTLLLLGLLIENRDRVVTKSEILESLWGSIYARDHLLFQLISELRKAPFCSDYVRTEPNHGYQWNVATQVQRFDFPRPAVAACLVVASLSSLATLFFHSESAPVSSQLPAYGAFSKGVLAMDKGQAEQAERWFKFALSENPNSVESSLFLAETLLQQNKVDESSDQLQALLEKQNLDDYSKMTATDLLSRISQRQGRLYEALNYAQASSQAGVIAQCSVDVVEQRVELLVDQLGVSQEISLKQPKGNEGVDQSAKNTSDEYNTKCSELQPIFEETSLCIPSSVKKWYAGHIIVDYSHFS